LVFCKEYNSGAKVDKAKIVLHESYCIKNMLKCLKCGEIVNKKEMEEHEEKQHKIVSCEYCSLPQESCKLKEHTDNCNMRQKPCPFCELELDHSKYMNHILICGSRTEQCPNCNKYIRKADWALHQEFNCEISINGAETKENKVNISNF